MSLKANPITFGEPFCSGTIFLKNYLSLRFSFVNVDYFLVFNDFLFFAIRAEGGVPNCFLKACPK